MSFRVLITDAVDPICVEMLEEAGMEADIRLKQSPEALKKIVSQYEGWIIRSGTKVTADLMEAAERLQVIGRAGVGVDNIDLEAATRKGVLVVNAPEGNTISTAEHTCAMILSLARNIPAANASLKEGAWERKAFSGTELYGKTLGIIGVGKIGRTVAQRMAAFGMDILGYDPMLSDEVARRYGLTRVSLPELLEQSDIITVHTPLNKHTRGMLNRETLAQCKPGVWVVNCARGGVVDEEALLEALESGQVGGAALDVYAQEPPGALQRRLIAHPRVVATPHLAASTAEAQEKVARQVTEEVIHALRGEPVRTPVNAMAIRMAAHPEVQPYLQLADRLGQVAAQLVDSALRRVHVRLYGSLTGQYADVLSLAVLKGILAQWLHTPVNFINAPVLAQDKGVELAVEKSSSEEDFTHLIEVIAWDEVGREVSLAGTVIGRREPRIVRLNGYHFEVRPEGQLLFYRNIDRPGMLARVGQLLAEGQINIAGLALGRQEPGSEALTAISVDTPVPEDMLEAIAAIPGIRDVRQVKIN